MKKKKLKRIIYDIESRLDKLENTGVCLICDEPPGDKAYVFPVVTDNIGIDVDAETGTVLWEKGKENQHG